MKKYLFLFLSAMCLIGCSSDEDDNNIDKLNQEIFTDCLIGHKWVYDNPNTGVWEEMNVLAGGIMYYSNSNSWGTNFTNKDVKCNYVYNVDNNAFIVTTEKLGTTEGIITKWNKYSFTWKIVNGSFEYGMLLETYTLKTGETLTPQYQSMVGDATIIGYSSHNTAIADVNSRTGEVVAKQTGRTYIDVVTDKGTAVVEIVVEASINCAYDYLIGKTREDVKNAFGADVYTESDEQIMYVRYTGDFKYIVVKFNTWTGLVRSVSLTVADNALFTDENLIDFLNTQYYVYEKGTTSTQKAYVNNEKYDDATAGIVYYTQQKQLVFVALDHDLFTDYSPFLGKTRNEVLSMMSDKTPFANTNAYIAYGLNETYLSMVTFYYTIDFNTYYETVQVVFDVLQNDVDESKVLEFLNKKYIYMVNVSSDNDKIFLTSDGMIVVDFIVNEKQIMYYKNGSSSTVNESQVNSVKRFARSANNLYRK